MEHLLDPAVTAGIRTRVDFDLTPTGAQARRLFTYGTNFIAALRALSADVTDADATLLLPSGDAERIGAQDESGLGAIAPGGSVTVHRSWDVPVPSPRGAGESDAGYLARLKILDGAALTGGMFVLANGGVGQLVAPLTTVTSHRTLPVVDITASGPTVVTSGTSADYELDVANVGSAEASALVVNASAASNPSPSRAHLPGSRPGSSRRPARRTRPTRRRPGHRPTTWRRDLEGRGGQRLRRDRLDGRHHRAGAGEAAGEPGRHARPGRPERRRHLAR